MADSLVQIQCVGGRQRVEGMALGDGPGTGLIVSPDGLILTSQFHFARTPNAILVTLPTGERLAARRLATDSSRGLVLLKVDLPAGSPPLTVSPLASVASARPGAWALAVGRAFDPDAVNVSVGVISATDRILTIDINDALMSRESTGKSERQEASSFEHAASRRQNPESHQKPSWQVPEGVPSRWRYTGERCSTRGGSA